MYYYEVTIYYVGTAEPYSFKIDEDELISFIKFITEPEDNLSSFKVIRHFTISVQ